jgi:hypothetical protein
LRSDDDFGYASVNSLQMYDEVHGTGKPLVLLHGGEVLLGVRFTGRVPYESGSEGLCDDLKGFL